VALLAPTAGCFEISAATVPPAILAANGWNENVTAGQSHSDFTGLSREEVRVFQHAPGSDGFGGSLSLVTIRAFLTPTQDSLRQQVQSTVQEQAAARNIDISGPAKNGGRVNSEKRSTLWFTFAGNASSSNGIFNADASVDIVGEVWDCPEARVLVVGVGLAQTNNVQSIGGFHVPQNPDYRTWYALIGDPQGSIDPAATQPGLLFSTTCTS
jgi:opacity protein-like surface antigen